MNNSDNINLDPNEENFEKLLEDSLMKRDNFSIGEEVSGIVVLITKDSVFVDISGKSEAIIDLVEFKGGDDSLPKVGDKINAYVVSNRRGEVHLTTCIGKGTTSLELIEISYNNNIPIEGTVLNTIRGGYTISISGIRGFCPLSQIDLKTPLSPEDYLDKTFTFKIIQFDDNGKNIVLSRRAFLEIKRETRKKEFLSSIRIGDTVGGVISSIQNFGIIVDLDGFEALIPKTEITWSRYVRLDSYVTGERVNAKVISIKEDNSIILSIKQLSVEPWRDIDKYKEGLCLNGIIINIIRNGVFVEIEPGLEGFIPVSKLSQIKRVKRPEDVVSIGDEIHVRIIEIKTDERKILLELLTNEPDPWQLPINELMDKVHQAIIESSRRTGLTIRLSNGMAGFVPKTELIKGEGDLLKIYHSGREINIVIKDLDKSEKRLIASEKDVVIKKEFTEYEEYIKESEEGFAGTTLGNLFKDKFNEIQSKMRQDDS